MRLTNFVARIVADITVDNGVDAFRELEIEAKIGSQTINFVLPAERFDKMEWVVTHSEQKRSYSRATASRSTSERLSKAIRQRGDQGHLRPSRLAYDRWPMGPPAR